VAASKLASSDTCPRPATQSVYGAFGLCADHIDDCGAYSLEGQSPYRPSKGFVAQARSTAHPSPGATLPFRRKMAAMAARLLCKSLSNESQRQPMTVNDGVE
jgi:hypothetical protein